MQVYCASIISIKLLKIVEMSSHQLGTKPFWPWGVSGKGFGSSGGWDLPGIPPPYCRGWGLGGRRPGTPLHNAALREPAKPSKCQAAWDYLVDEGDLIDISASAEPGKEWDPKYQDAQFT